MSELLETAVRRARERPEEEQDELALTILARLADDRAGWTFSEEQLAEVKEVKARVEAGLEPMVSDEDLAAFRRRRGL